MYLRLLLRGIRLLQLYGEGWELRQTIKQPVQPQTTAPDAFYAS